MVSSFFLNYIENEERRRRCHTHGDTYFYEKVKKAGEGTEDDVFSARV